MVRVVPREGRCEVAPRPDCNPEAGLFCSLRRETVEEPDLFGVTRLEGETDKPKPWTPFFFFSLANVLHNSL